MKPVATSIDLFAGCGGMSCGLLRAGVRVALGIDSNAAAVDTFQYNHEHVGARGLVGDIREISGQNLIEKSGLSSPPQLMTGGPPCQPFSIIGKRQGLSDERGNLVFEFVRLLSELQPEAFIFENVAAFTTIENGSVADATIKGMQRAGYAVSYGVLNAAHFGVAQMRKRFFVLGVRGKRQPGLPLPTHGDSVLLGQSPVVPVRMVLDDLPDVDAAEASSVPNHEGTSHSEAMVQVFQNLGYGDRDPKSHHDKLDPERPSFTLRAGFGNFSPLRPVHYKYPRVISVRESARIQGFPDDFVWPDDMSRLQQYRQVGNAVPPPVASILARHIATILGWRLDPATYAVPLSRTDRRHSLSVEERAARRKSYIRGASIGRPALPQRKRSRSRRALDDARET